MNTHPQTLEEMIREHIDFSEHTPEEQELLIVKTRDMLNEAALLRSLHDAGEETQKAFAELMEGESDRSLIQAFVQKSLPRFNEYIHEEIKIFKDLQAEEKTNA